MEGQAAEAEARDGRDSRRGENLQAVWSPQRASPTPSLRFTCTGRRLLPHTPVTPTGAFKASWGPTETKPLEASLPPEQVGNQCINPLLSPAVGTAGGRSTLSSRRSRQDWAPRALRALSPRTPPFLARSLPCLTSSRPCWHLPGPLSRPMTSDPASGGAQAGG